MKKQSASAIESFEKISTHQGGKLLGGFSKSFTNQGLINEHALRSNNSDGCAGNIQCAINCLCPPPKNL
jgi:hypothetical protein